MPYLIFILSFVSGFILNNLLTKPNAYLNKRIPKVKVKFIQLLPSLKVKFGKRTIHIHHWIGYSIILVITITLKLDLFSTLYARGYFAGSIIQGLTFPDWKKIVYKETS